VLRGVRRRTRAEVVDCVASALWTYTGRTARQAMGQGRRRESIVIVPPREARGARPFPLSSRRATTLVNRNQRLRAPCLSRWNDAAHCSARTSIAGASVVVETPVQVEHASHRHEALFCSLRRIHAALGGRELRPDHVAEVKRVEIVELICRRLRHVRARGENGLRR
jgi:hypothetical protein